MCVCVCVCEGERETQQVWQMTDEGSAFADVCVRDTEEEDIGEEKFVFRLKEIEKNTQECLRVLCVRECVYLGVFVRFFLIWFL